MTLSRTSTLLAALSTHVQSLDADTFVQNCLAQYLAVVFYSEMEERIAEIISQRLQEYTSSPIGLYLTSNLEKIIRRTQKSDLAELLKNFGEEFKASFNSKIGETDVSIYSNVITARHNVGHRQGSNITLAEIENAIQSANRILNALHCCFDDARKAVVTE